MCERHWRKGTDAKKMPGTTITKDLTGMEERIFLVLAGSVSCSPKGSRNGHSGTKTSRRSHRPLPLLRQDPAQCHKDPKEQEKQADSFSGVLPGHSPSACSVPPRFSQVVQGFSPGPQSLHKKCLPAKTRSSELELGADKGCAIQTGRACPVSPLTGMRHGTSKSALVAKSTVMTTWFSGPAHPVLMPACRSTMPGIRSFMARLSRTSCSLPRKRTSP